MSPDEFLKCWQSRKKSKWDPFSSTYAGAPWEYVYYVRELTSLIDYGCDFKNNRCVRERENIVLANWSEISYCCSACSENVGLLNIFPDNEQAFTEIASYFCEETGFWRKDLGCILPRKYRSSSCLGICGYLKKNKQYTKDELTILKCVRLVNFAWATYKWNLPITVP